MTQKPFEALAVYESAVGDLIHELGNFTAPATAYVSDSKGEDVTPERSRAAFGRIVGLVEEKTPKIAERVREVVAARRNLNLARQAFNDLMGDLKKTAGVEPRKLSPRELAVQELRSLAFDANDMNDRLNTLKRDGLAIVDSEEAGRLAAMAFILQTRLASLAMNVSEGGQGRQEGGSNV